MITANATQIGNKIRLEIAHPEKGNQVTTVTSQGEAMRVVYFANRAYMISKLTSWLKQRMYGTEPARSQEAAKLLVLLGYYEHLSFRKLCVVIHQNRSAIEGIAPGPKSRVFNYYNNIIVPILNDATEIGG